MSYTKRNLGEIEDVAPQFGFGEVGEARFAMRDLEALDTGLAFHRIKPGRRQAFSHTHEKAEEIYVVLRGSGRLKLDDEIIAVGPLDAIRVSPEVQRAFAADDDGLEYLAFGPHVENDGDLKHDDAFWD